MGLGRLNPGCRDDPCDDCRECLLWLDGCTLRWDCPRAGMRILGPNLDSTSHTGSVTFPADGYYRILVNGLLVAELTINGLPSSCCEQGAGPSCQELHPDLSGLRINVSGFPVSEANGLYIVYSDLSGIPSATRVIAPNSVRLTGRYDCQSDRTSQFEYIYEFGCDVNSTEGGIIRSEVFGRLVLDMKIYRTARCGSFLTAIIYYSTRNRYTAESGITYICVDETFRVLVTGLDIGCPDPASDIVNVDLSAFGQYDSSYWQSCSWARLCCDNVVS